MVNWSYCLLFCFIALSADNENEVAVESELVQSQEVKKRQGDVEPLQNVIKLSFCEKVGLLVLNCFGYHAEDVVIVHSRSSSDLSRDRLGSSSEASSVDVLIS